MYYAIAVRITDCSGDVWPENISEGDGKYHAGY